MARDRGQVNRKLVGLRFNGAAPLEADSVKAVIAEGERKLGDKGRPVIRKSGTEPVIRVMAEGEDEGVIVQVVEQICAAVEAA